MRIALSVSGFPDTDKNEKQMPGCPSLRLVAGSIAMVGSTRQVQSEDPYGRFDEAINDPRLYAPYEFQRAEAQDLDALPHDRVPIFLAEQDPRFEPTPEYSFGRKKKTRGSRIVTGLFALSAAAAILGLVSVDATRAVIVNAKASLASVAPLPFGGTPQDNPSPGPNVAAAPPALAAPAATPDTAATRAVQPVAPVSASPSRDEIATAYQTAIKTRVVAVEPVTRESPPPARRIDADELAMLLKRAKGLLAIGDITAARLLLERAADAQEAEAALMLGGTYDPQVLGTQDMRSITPDPATARLWYQKAVQLGSSDARRYLSQIRN
jgi:TPR repeat protein